MERLTFALDEESKSILQQFSDNNNLSKTAVMRLALQSLQKQSKLEEICEIEKLYTYGEFLANKDHIILDIDHWESFFKEIDEGSESFWKEVYDIGVEHQKEYYNKGLREVKDILKFVEKTNWYILNQDSETSFTLILNLSTSAKFVEQFFKGFFQDYPRKIVIMRGGRKIRILIER